MNRSIVPLLSLYDIVYNSLMLWSKNIAHKQTSPNTSVQTLNPSTTTKRKLKFLINLHIYIKKDIHLFLMRNPGGPFTRRRLPSRPRLV